jgi:hypothetical protein
MTSRGMMAIGFASDMPRRATIEMMDFILKDCGMRLYLKHDCDFSNTGEIAGKSWSECSLSYSYNPFQVAVRDLDGTYLE